MVYKMMGSQSDAGTSLKQSHQFQPLTRQNSMYNLTLDEVQNHLGDLGKPLSSMNLDELLQNVLTAEANQSANAEPEVSTNLPNQSSLQRQASLAISGALSKKTVDEVWKDIQRSKSNGQKESYERQPTLGEITLEDFLVKAGVVAESSLDKKSNENPGSAVDPNLSQQFPQQHQWIQYQQQSYQHPQQGIMGVYMPLENQMGTLSDTQMPGRKRGAPAEIIEKTVERRQKRMIKNRESAARSRARKQAYTNELEHKVSRLEEENERLKKRKELEKILQAMPLAEPKYRLRRTSSSTF